MNATRPSTRGCTDAWKRIHRCTRDSRATGRYNFLNFSGRRSLAPDTISMYSDIFPLTDVEDEIYSPLFLILH